MTDPVAPPGGDDDDALKKLAGLFAAQERQAEKVVPFQRPANATRTAEEPEPPSDSKKKPPKEKKPKAPRAYIELGDDCPVKPLGVSGSEYYFLDAIKQLVVKHADKLGQNGIDDLFKHSSAQRWADANFGRKGEDGVINGIDRDLLKRAMIAACGDLSERGVFDPSGSVRGAGAWRDELGRLVMHLGQTVLTYDSAGKEHEGKPGLRDSMIYPLSTNQMRPAPIEDARGGAAASELLGHLDSWNWKRGTAARPLDSLLMLGWITTAPMGGALKWRPAAWVTGDLSTGKSTLLDLVMESQGGQSGVVKAANATGAGIWQKLKYRSMPVILDEVEAGKNNEGKQALIELMRVAASGDVLRRGGADHTAVEFMLFSNFLFSSINILPLPPQDISRLALLELNDLPTDAPKPNFNPARLRAIGAVLRRRVIQAWPQWDEHFAQWWAPINQEFGRRTADTFGTLLAMAHIALCDTVAHADTVEETIAPLIPSLRQWQAIAGRDWQLMLNHLGTWQLEPWDRGRKVTVRQLVHWASARAKTNAAHPTFSAEDTDQDNDEAQRFGVHIERDKAGSALRLYGLAVIRSRAEEDRGKEYLAIAYRHSGLSRIFSSSIWKDSGWRQSATRVPGNVVRKARFESAAEDAVMVPISAILGEEGG